MEDGSGSCVVRSLVTVDIDLLVNKNPKNLN
jgi:hypothetical protein